MCEVGGREYEGCRERKGEGREDVTSGERVWGKRGEGV